MLRHLPALLLITLVLSLLGCRDALVDEQLPPDTQSPPTDTATVSAIYLKGPDTLRIGSTQAYRAESLPDAARYQWLLGSGTGTVTGDSDHPLLRLYDITGVSPGPVTLIVQAFDEDNNHLADGTKTIMVAL